MVLKGLKKLAGQSGSQPQADSTPDTLSSTSAPSHPQQPPSHDKAPTPVNDMYHVSESTSDSSGPGVDTGEESDAEVNHSSATRPKPSMSYRAGENRPGEDTAMNNKPLPYPPPTQNTEAAKDLPSPPTSDLSDSQRADFEARYPPIIEGLGDMSLGDKNTTNIAASTPASDDQKVADQRPAQGTLSGPQTQISTRPVAGEADLISAVRQTSEPEKQELSRVSQPGSDLEKARGTTSIGLNGLNSPPNAGNHDGLGHETSHMVDQAFSQSSTNAPGDAPFSGSQAQPQEGNDAPLDDRWWEETGALDQPSEPSNKTADNFQEGSGQTADNAVVAPVQSVATDQIDGPPHSENAREGYLPGSSPSAVSEAQPGPETSPSVVTEAQQDAANTAIPQQTSEKYQIKHVNWTDGTSSNLRRSPILVQNANGPCPLVALVNALALSAPAESGSVVVETLQAREQISLEFLLDTVLDELMSPRADVTGPALPDIADLYMFLKTLHTGMNVNPRFVRAHEPAPNLMDAPIDTSDGATQPSQDAAMVGSFEDTQGMRLYGTFSIPLVHGWLPRRDHPVYAALQRSAPTYEDAQNVLFREEELEEKLQGQGLNDDEQQLLQDVVIIKYFLMESATQLTQYGLEVLSEALAPGSLSILFRNDHFSTIYKHPSSHQLLQLVTDAGYSSHAEIVWESLVDVTGEGSEFFAGDFRPVGNNAAEPSRPQGGPQQVRSLLDDEVVWTTVQDRRNKHRRKTSRRSNGSSNIGSIGERLETNLSVPAPAPFASGPNPPHSPATEQEDHDLALALQLQEEEEDLHRRDQAARRLGQSFAESVGTPPRTRPVGQRSPGLHRPPAPVRQEIRSLIPPLGSSPPRRQPQPAPQPPAEPSPPRPIPITTGPSADDSLDPDAPPPSYEQAARDNPYVPPPDHPAHSSSPAQRHSPNHSRPRPSRDGPSTQRATEHPSSPSPAGPTTAGPPSPSAGRRYNRASRERHMLGNHAEFVSSTNTGSGGIRRRQNGGLGPLSIGVQMSSNSSGGSASSSVETKKECVVM